jgi:hypothetical protein
MPAKIQRRPHRVLVRTKVGKAMRDKVIQCQQRLRARDRPVEAAQVSGVVGNRCSTSSITSRVMAS